LLLLFLTFSIEFALLSRPEDDRIGDIFAVPFNDGDGDDGEVKASHCDWPININDAQDATAANSIGGRRIIFSCE